MDGSQYYILPPLALFAHGGYGVSRTPACPHRAQCTPAPYTPPPYMPRGGGGVSRLGGYATIGIDSATLLGL